VKEAGRQIRSESILLTKGSREIRSDIQQARQKYTRQKEEVVAIEGVLFRRQATG